MTVYNFNLGIGWASSGVEYAQAYRAQVFRKLGVDAKFIFTDFITAQNIERYTKNIGFKDSEVIWLYTAFTDFEVGPTTYTLADLEKHFPGKPTAQQEKGDRIRYEFADGGWIIAKLEEAGKQRVQWADFGHGPNLMRRDFYSSGRFLAEFYAPQEKRVELRLRRFYNQNGSIAYEELPGAKGQPSFFRFKNKLIYSKAELISEFINQLKLSASDTILIDRATGMAQQILENRGPARVGVVVHADHFNAHRTNDDNILWNNYYEYTFQHADLLDFFVTATAAQKTLLAAQFKKYTNFRPQIYAIPVGSLSKLRKGEERTPFSLITASRLASEKHVDWLVSAVVKAKQELPELTLDIYGYGGELAALKSQIKAAGAEGYIRLKGHQDRTDVYTHYQAYLSGSTSEGFGLTLLEAVGSGLAMIGFDVRYGNQTFIADGKNGILLPYNQDEDSELAVNDLAGAVVRLFKKLDFERARQVSYDLARAYLTTEVENKWQALLEGEKHD